MLLHSAPWPGACGEPPMPKGDFRSTLKWVWFRFIALGVLGLVFAEALKLAQGEAQGWTYYLPISEVIFEVIVRLIFAGLVGIVAGTALTVMLAPVLWFAKSSRDRVADWALKVVGILVLFLVSRFALKMMLAYLGASYSERYSGALLTGYLIVFVAILFIPRSRKKILTSLDGFLGENVTRRTAIATVVGAAGLVATEFAISRTAPIVKAALAPLRPKSNVILITFDALAAEDMSVYGYKLPTTRTSALSHARHAVQEFLFGVDVYDSEYCKHAHRGLSLRAPRLSAHRSLAFAGRVEEFASPDARRRIRHGRFPVEPIRVLPSGGHGNQYDFLPEPVFQHGGLQHLWDGPCRCISIQASAIAWMSTTT